MALAEEYNGFDKSLRLFRYDIFVCIVLNV